MSILGRFQPDTLITGVAPCRSAEEYVTVSVCDSPGNKVMSLPCQIADCNSLSPLSSVPLAVPRRTSARMRNATVDAEVVAVAVMADCGSDCSDCRLA